MRRVSLALGAILIVVAAAIAIWLDRELRTPYFAGAAATVFVDIPRGSSTARIARLLREAGVLRLETPFRLHVTRSGQALRLQAGEYRFEAPATPTDIAERLARGDVHFVTLTVPEGLTAQETAAHAMAAGLGDPAELTRALGRTDWIRDLDPAATSLEGYLFPETYRFGRATPSEDVLRTMVERFRQVYARLEREHPPQPGWTARAIVVLASLVEKEVADDAERGRVASVLVNRLRISMPLACDPTVVYALKLAGGFDGNIRKRDLAIASPYNTYRHPGLPPGPISNPGEASLRAALRPAQTDFLYFVSRNDGTHEFSRDYRAHSRAVAHFQAPRVSRRGPAAVP